MQLYCKDSKILLKLLWVSIYVTQSIRKQGILFCSESNIYLNGISELCSASARIVMSIERTNKRLFFLSEDDSAPICAGQLLHSHIYQIYEPILDYSLNQLDFLLTLSDSCSASVS